MGLHAGTFVESFKSKFVWPPQGDFRAARKKHIDSLISNGAVKILSVEESLEFQRMFPNQVIESRFIDRCKPKEIDVKRLEHYKKKAIHGGHLEAVPLEKDHTSPKSRWCVVGWKDPDVHAVGRSAPTPLRSSLYCCFQLAASRHWDARVKDVKTASLQSLPTTRTRKLACRQPRDEPLPGLDPRQIMLLLTEVYGLVSGPSWWRRSVIVGGHDKTAWLCPQPLRPVCLNLAKPCHQKALEQML